LIRTPSIYGTKLLLWDLQRQFPYLEENVPEKILIRGLKKTAERNIARNFVTDASVGEYRWGHSERRLNGGNVVLANADYRPALIESSGAVYGTMEPIAAA